MRSVVTTAFVFFILVSAQQAGAADSSAPAQGRVVNEMPAILTPRQRIAPVRAVIEQRLDTLLPGLMREAGLDMWLVINREYNEDPVFWSLVADPVFAARRTTMLVFFDRGEAGVERFSVSRYPIAGLYEAAWEGGDLDEQWQRLAQVIAERDPQRIGINKSRDWPTADGLSAGLHEQLVAALSPTYRERLVSSQDLVVRWLETRTPAEISGWRQAVSIARATISEAFSSRVITPGATTTEDVEWYIRERFEALGLKPWFQPHVNVQRQGDEVDPDGPFYGATGRTILAGDVLHTDVGICYLRLCTDTQEMGYVLKLGESAVPEGLRVALATGNRWQDILTGAFKTGRTGNEILAVARKAQDKAGIKGSVYTHPLGLFGHAPGPTIGMWDNQGPTAIRGDWPLHAQTGYAIEGNVKVAVPEWNNQLVQIKLEQSALFDGQQVLYLAGRQSQWHVVR